MSTSAELLQDPRRRTLAILAGAALISILAAFLALQYQSAQTQATRASETFFPSLAHSLPDVAKIHIESSKGAFDVVLGTDKQWRVAQRAGYPASFDQIRQTLIGLSTLQTIEPKTTRPDWFSYVNLDAPPRGSGVLIRVSGNKGDELADIIIGKSEDIGDPGGAMGLFVRKPRDMQSWLARSVFEPKSESGDWLDKTVLNVDRARVQEVDVTPQTGPAFVVRREKPSDPDFALLNIPRGRELSNVGAPDNVASAVAGFTFDDVRPAKAFDFSKATQVVTKTFDGLTVTASIVREGQDSWAEIAAAGAPQSPAAQKEARDIVARASGWAYKLPDYKGQQFLTTLDSLLKPLTPPAKTGG
jgi:hypothetical protein